MLNGETVIYVGNLYEKKVVGATTTHTKYYYFGGRRIAVRVAGTLYWLLSDHLGSTTVTADGATGARTAELWYKPWGESRGAAFGVTPTARRFTGQTLDGVAGGLYFYNARYYDPMLGRFTQADTIVPEPGNPQALNRYSYALNNAIKYSDPTGHRVCEDEDCRIPRRPPRGSRFPDRDLTPFAVVQGQMMTNDPSVLVIAIYNHSGVLAAKTAAYLGFERLVGDGKRWDLKDKMRDQLGSSFMLCSASVCYWFEYSVLGNILYGYVGAQAGFAEWEIRAGAGYAEARDPENSAKFDWPGVHPIAYLPEERRSSYYDDPLDYNAVSMGIAMSKRYGANVTLQAFQALVAEYHEKLAPGTPNYGPVKGPGGPYQAGRFDQSNEVRP